MGENKQLGVFWGRNNLCFVATESGKPTAIFGVPLPRETGSGSLEAGPFSPLGMEIISLIQNTFHQNKVAPGTVTVSLPTRDIIFRSFIIPWMQPNEVKGVVDFEASKYVPFALHDLSYSFYPMTVTEGNLRRIRIIFVAIKKVVLESYRQIFEQAALRVHIAEPATLSLIRTMAAKELLPREETVALVEIGDETGNIIVVDHQMPQFVREFQLRIPAQKDVEPPALMARMMNELRISLNYFNRQEDRFKVKKMVLLSSSDPADIIRRLEEDLHMPVVPVTTDSVLVNAPSSDVNFLKAYGAALYHAINLPVDLNLSETRVKTVKLAAPSAPRALNFKVAAVTILLCLAVVFLSFFVTRAMVQKQEARSAALGQELKSSKEISVPKVRQENESLDKKLNYLKNIQVGSDIAAVLVAIPDLLPDGVWVDQIDIVYPDVLSSDKDKKKDGRAVSGKADVTTQTRGKPTVDIKGYAYASDPSDQFKLVNDLLANFKGNKEFSAFFDNMDFESIQAKSYGKYPVTFFYLKCR